MFQGLALGFFFPEGASVDHVLGEAGLAGGVFVALVQHVLDGLHRVAQVADLEGDVAHGGGGFGLGFLDLDLGELALQPADFVLEFLLRDLGLAEVVLIGLLGVGEFLGVVGQVGLEFLEFAGQRAGEVQVAGAVVGQDAAGRGRRP